MNIYARLWQPLYFLKVIWNRLGPPNLNLNCFDTLMVSSVFRQIYNKILTGHAQTFHAKVCRGYNCSFSVLRAKMLLPHTLDKEEEIQYPLLVVMYVLYLV